jgi:spore photoproduct lyase
MSANEFCGQQLCLFGNSETSVALPLVYEPRQVEGCSVERIILAKGSLVTPEREAFVRRICEAYPGVPVEEQLEVPHNRVRVGEADPLLRREKGKRTLLFGELGLKSAVWKNKSRGGMYPYPRFFSVYGLCPYRCVYCYLNVSRGTPFSPSVKIYVNLPDIVAEIDRQANEAAKPTAFYLGKMQDGLALDPLTGYSQCLVPFFARHRFARQVIQTKSADVERLLELEHQGRTALSWTLTPGEIAERYEPNAPSTEARLHAMERCAKAGYPVCVNVAPIIPAKDWEARYLQFVREILARVPIRRFFFGGLCMDRVNRSLLEQRMGKDNAISRQLYPHESNASNYWAYRSGFADPFFREVMKLGRDAGSCRFELERLDGGALVVEFGERGNFDVFAN